jgi:hypothetical protein
VDQVGARDVVDHGHLNVRCFGEPRDPDFHGATVKAYPVPADLKGANPAGGNSLEMMSMRT